MNTKYDRWHLLDQVIAKLGFEVEETIEFAFLCENGTDEQIAETFEKIMKQGLTINPNHVIINI